MATAYIVPNPQTDSRYTVLRCSEREAELLLKILQVPYKQKLDRHELQETIQDTIDRQAMLKALGNPSS